MASGWHNKLTRLSQMNWEEISTRAAQEIHKRVDLARHQMGIRPGPVRLGELPSGGRHFFFTGQQARQRAELLREHLPAEAEEILREADEICGHRFQLLGYEGLDYGSEIDWHLDRVHGKRAPLDPWFKVAFLDFTAVGDHKVIWELNRHQHLVTLAKAWLLSGDEKYIRELMAQWRSWIQANPYPLGINWGSTLEVAFRSLSWIWVDHLLAADAGRGRPALHQDFLGYAEFRADLVQALAFHGRYIERYLSTYFSPNTHLLGEATALFFLGTLYPEIPGAGRWQETGWKILLHEAQRQVRPDGVYFEQSLYYHVYALDFFLYARLLAARNEVEVPPAFDEVLQRMLQVVEALSQAGPPEGFGDDDGGRVFNPRRNHTEHMTDPLALGASLYERHAYPAARLTEESIWLFGQAAIDALSRTSDEAELHSTVFPDGGIYVLANSEPYPEQIVVDAGPQGTGRCGHGHADSLSLRLTMNGRRWLVDAGSGVYISANPANRNLLRGTTAHNTMGVDGVDQAIPEEPFSWTAIPSTQVEQWITGKTFSYFVGSHDGYARLADPVIHQRHVLQVNGGPCLVRDLALGRQEHDLELMWHFASDLEVRETDQRSFAVCSPGDTERTGASLRLVVADDASWKTDITEGILSSAYGATEATPVIRSRARVTLPAEIATALQPQAVTIDPKERLQLVSAREPAAQAYELAQQGESRLFCFALDKRPWVHGAWSSDAELLYCHFAGEQLVHLIVAKGSHVAWQGQELLKANSFSDVFEWRKRDGMLAGQDVFTVSPLFAELTGSSPVTSGVSSTYAEKK